MRFVRLSATFFLNALFLGAFSAVSVVSAADFPFSDVSAWDPIYSDLKKLYERGVIDSPTDGKFHPEALMDRDEFTSIAIGVGCRKCLTPTLDDILKYRTAPFLDFNVKSPFFYCVSYAKEQRIVEGYAIAGSSSYACQDGKNWEGVPFCAKNKTSRIEAAAVLLRQAGLWDAVKNASAFQKRVNLSDVSDYWYGYAQKGVEVGILTASPSGTIRGDEYLTKREFVRMAAIIFSFNLCEIKGMSASWDRVSSEIRVIPAASQCRDSTLDANLATPKESYGFFGRPDIENAAYRWEFFPATGTGASVSAEGKCLSDFKLAPGEWIAKLVITAPDGRTSVSYAQIPFWAATSGLSAIISANPLETPAGVSVNFKSAVTGGTGPYSYRWDFSDGTVSNGSDPKHAFASAGTYPVTLIVTDAEGNRAVSRLVETVTENPDLDGDGILNAEDSCPTAYGPKSNAGCPVIAEYGKTSGTSFSNGVALTVDSIGSRCLLSLSSNVGAIFGKASCGTCPCTYDLDFTAQVRRCDLLFPTILSPDKKTIYGRGAVYEVR